MGNSCFLTRIKLNNISNFDNNILNFTTMVTVHSTSEFRAVVHGQNHGEGNDLLPGQRESRETLKAKKVGASVIVRKYDLNELTALKKKL